MANTKVTSRVLADDAVGLAQLNISNDPSNGQALTYVASSNDLQWATVSGSVAGISSSADATAITIDSSENVTFAQKVGIGITPTHNFNLSSAGAVEARFTSTDNDCYLQIASDTDEGQDSVLQFLSGTSARGSITYDHNATAADQSMIFKTGDNAVIGMTISGTGNVKVGRDQDISMDANGSGQLIIDGNGYVGAIALNADAMHIYSNSASRHLIFGTNETERMRVTSGGQVLINATNANYPTDYATEGSVATTIIRGPETAATDNALFVYGGRIALNAHPARYATRAYIQSDGGGMKIWHTDNSDMIFAVNNAEKVRIQYSDGIIKCFGIYAHATSGTVRDVYIEDGGQLGYSSSVKAHKTNITDYTDASWLYNLNPKQFNRRKKNMVIETNDDGVDHTVHDGTYSDTEFHTPVEVGFLAEDVEALDSKLCFYDVVTDEDGNESEQLAGIHYKNMVAPMLKLIQEQKTLIDDLTARIETLESN